VIISKYSLILSDFKMGVLPLIRIKTVHISLIDIALKSVRFRFREYWNIRRQRWY